jgi:hypothetical protein
LSFSANNISAQNTRLQGELIKMKEIPEPPVVLRDLSHFFPIFNSAFQQGTFKAFEYFDKIGVDHKDIDPYLASSLVRYHARDVLRNSGQKIVDVDHLLNFQNVPNIGIYLSSGRYNIRILKSKNGDIPAPGHSTKRQEYYQQIQPQTAFDFYEEVAGGKLNLLVLWDVIPPYNLSSTVVLACPKDGGETRGSVIVHWKCEVPQEIILDSITAQVKVAKEVSNEIEDLPISRNVIVETETEK